MCVRVTQYTGYVFCCVFYFSGCRDDIGGDAIWVYHSLGFLEGSGLEGIHCCVYKGRCRNR